MPERVQLRRTKGWRMPPNTVKVDRSTKWGNPFHVHGDGYPMTNELAVSLFRSQIAKEGGYIAPRQRTVTTVEDIKRELRGKNLACWCAEGEPCHANVLIEVANS